MINLGDTFAKGSSVVIVLSDSPYSSNYVCELYEKGEFVSLADYSEEELAAFDHL